MVQYVNFHTLAILFTGLALGGMMFFSFVLAPLLFRKLGSETAAGFMRSAFPVYYKVMAALTGLAAVLVYYRGEAVALAIVCGLFVLGWLILLPAVERHRAGRAAGEPAATAAFRRLHRFSVFVNLGQIIVILVVFMRLAA
jgi:hypothetical protein